MCAWRGNGEGPGNDRKGNSKLGVMCLAATSVQLVLGAESHAGGKKEAKDEKEMSIEEMVRVLQMITNYLLKSALERSMCIVSSKATVSRARSAGKDPVLKAT